MRATGTDGYYIEIQNGLYVITQEVDKVVTEISTHETMKEAQEALNALVD